MTIQWLGHACFCLASGGYRIVLDPYKDGAVPGLRPLRVEANAALCSHGHADHSWTQAVTLVPQAAPSPFAVTAVQSAHDGEGGAKRGMNTIHVLAAEGLRVAHLGDLGAPLTQAQAEAIGPLDALMIPVGGHYTIDAATAHDVVRTLAPRVVLPMHYRGAAFGYDEIGTLDAFLALMGNAIHYGTDTLALAPQTPAQTAVLAYTQE